MFYFSITPAFADSLNDYEYQLYTNLEDFGIVVYPKEGISQELDEYIQSIRFKPVVSGKAVMRIGPDGENRTYMMPKDVQDRYSIKKFIILQVLTNSKLQVGIFDPDWGLILPPQTFQLDEIKESIKETLNIFRGSESIKKISWTSR